MANDHEIGRIVAVDTAQVTVELNKEMKAFIRSTYEDTYEVGRINSYLIIPVGAKRIVAMITRVALTEESELKADKTMVTLPSSRRLMKATMIGTIEGSDFKQGISIFPVLDSPVQITSKSDLDAIFGTVRECAAINCDDPGYCIPIGKSAVFPEYDIRINPDAFFGKHAAVIGSTGSGKSCTIATILQSILDQSDVKQTRFVILDTNGEYRSAFQKKENDSWSEARSGRKTLYIPTDSNDEDHLVIPYWFMDSEDFTRLFRASPGVQRPVLMSALSSARNSATESAQWIGVREKLIRELNAILSDSKKHAWPSSNNVFDQCTGILAWLQRPDVVSGADQLHNIMNGFSIQNIQTVINNVQNTIGPLDTRGNHPNLDLNKEDQIRETISPILQNLTHFPVLNANIAVGSADSPRFFSKQDFRHQYLDDAMDSREENSGRARDNCSTMLMRIFRLLEDSRFEFLFGPATSEWPNVKHSLAAFLRDILGMESVSSGLDNCDKVQLPFYERQRNCAVQSNIVIVDLSLLASEVLENVTALLGRLIHEFLQRLSDPDSGIERGEFPVVLVLEEAQNYIREGHRLEEESISKLIFERIAREGRKYGLGLVVASQRPSELSKTVLSQCNSFIVHRLQNPEDIRYFKDIVPGIFDQLLDQLPALAPRTALVLGECVQAPAMVVMREANPVPRSKNPQFYRSWTESEPKTPDVEKICAKWEGHNVYR